MVQPLRVLSSALVVLLVLVVEADGQRLLEIDGVELRGEAQLLQSGGGTCNVLESDTRYEERLANHGSPMDIWRLDFSVRNGSGQWLDHLIARFQIESEWPECTNWDVPNSARLAIQYPSAIIEWGGSIGHLQESGRNVVSPGQTLSDTRLLIVLRGDPAPRFSNWSMDFDFAAAPPPGDSATGAVGATSSVQAPSATGGAETVFWQSIVNSTARADFEAYLAQFPNGVFRALAENRLEALNTPTASAGSASVAHRSPAAPTLDGSANSGGDFGDDSGEFANDGDCDDTRFVGDRGAAALNNESHIGRDATDCRNLLRDGRISWSGGGDFGDDSGEFANDGDCDDTRFVGDRGAAALTDDSHIGKDATDCRNLVRDGRISWSSDAANTASLPGRRSVTDRPSDEFSTSVIVSNCAVVGTRVCIENRGSQTVFVRFCTPDVDGRYTPGLCAHTGVRANDGYVHQGSTDHVAETYWRACALDNAKEAQAQTCYFELPQ